MAPKHMVGLAALVLPLAFGSPVSAFSWDGMAWEGPLPCIDRHQVSTPNGESIVRWLDAPSPRSGAMLIGDFETIGIRRVKLEEGGYLTVDVQLSRLTQGQVMNMIRRCTIASMNSRKRR